MYACLLTQLKNQGLSRAALDVIFNAIVLSVVTYALSSFAVQLSKADKGRLDNLFHKALRRGVCSQSFTIDDLKSHLSASAFRVGHYGAIQMLYYYIIISATDKKLFRRITSNNNHCLHSFPQKGTQKH